MTTRGFTQPSHTALLAAGPRFAFAGCASLRLALEQYAPGAATTWSTWTAPRARPYQRGINPPLWECAHAAWFAEWWCVRGAFNTVGGGTVGAAILLARGRCAVQLKRDCPRSALAVAAAHAKACTRLHGRDARTVVTALMRVVMTTKACIHSVSRCSTRRCTWRPSRGVRRRSIGGLPVGAPAARQGIGRPSRPRRRASGLAGYDGPGFSFDNERGLHDVAIAAFSIDRTPVSNAQFGLRRPGAFTALPVLRIHATGAMAGSQGVHKPRPLAAPEHSMVQSQRP